MKRIAIFFDGTWNRMSAENPTNVLIAAQAVLPKGKDDVPQLVYYDEGIGTTFLVNERVEAWIAGATGRGVFDKIASAYRFLIFNYEPGDEIFVFGFSRGAFTARSLAGLLRKCGVIPRSRARSIKEAFDFYKTADKAPDSDDALMFRMEKSPHMLIKPDERDWRVAHGADSTCVAELKLLTIKYVGVWDTVKAMGLPGHLLISKLTNRISNAEFYDDELSSIVHSARHAVAADEERLSFKPKLWDNLNALNNSSGGKSDYKQWWFPGDHGSVGGGGDIRGLSADALLWVLEGAEMQGLAFDPGRLELEKAKINNFVSLHNQSRKPGFMSRLLRRGPRDAPVAGDQAAASTTARMARIGGTREPGEIRDWEEYRPRPLKSWWP